MSIFLGTFIDITHYLAPTPIPTPDPDPKPNTNPILASTLKPCPDQSQRCPKQSLEFVGPSKMTISQTRPHLTSRMDTQYVINVRTHNTHTQLPLNNTVGTLMEWPLMANNMPYLDNPHVQPRL